MQDEIANESFISATPSEDIHLRGIEISDVESIESIPEDLSPKKKKGSNNAKLSKARKNPVSKVFDVKKFTETDKFS